MLTLEIEYLLGVAFAATVEDRGRAEWPPHPDRVFSALVSAWAEGSRGPVQRKALEWLEAAGLPLLHAPDAFVRPSVNAYVPPNDMTATGKSAVFLIPDMRKNRQPRQFPAVLPHSPTVQLTWTAQGLEPEARKALAELARDVPYLGHSASLVRMAVVGEEVSPKEPTHVPGGAGGEVLRGLYPGRLRDLLDAFDTERPQGNAGVPWRPPPGPRFAYSRPVRAATAPPEPLLGEEWLVFGDEGGTPPALTAFPRVSKRVRDALLAHAGPDAPEVLSGHSRPSVPSASPHLAVVPLADVGWEHSSGRLLGFGLVLPRALERDRASPERAAALRAIARFASATRDVSGEPLARLKLGRLGDWLLQRETGGSRRSLDPRRYFMAAKRWASVTPVVLDRFPKEREGQDAEALVARACSHAGLPLPVSVTLHKHSAIRGAPSAWPPGHASRWEDWSFPPQSALAERPRRHVVLEFEEKVRGPVLIGAGRYQGMGLCLPLPEEGDQR